MSWLGRSSLLLVIALLMACGGDDPAGNAVPEDVSSDLTADSSGDVSSDDIVVEPDVASDTSVTDATSDVVEDAASDVTTDITESLSCEAFAACEAAVVEGCSMIREASEAYACEAACLELATSCEEAAACLPEDTSVVTPFDGGPSGVVPRDLAGDFTLPTLIPLLHEHSQRPRQIRPADLRPVSRGTGQGRRHAPMGRGWEPLSGLLRRAGHLHPGTWRYPPVPSDRQASRGTDPLL